MSHLPDDDVRVTQPDPAGPAVTHVSGSRGATGADPSTGQLVSQLSAEMSRLVRDEMRLAQLEVTGKARSFAAGVEQARTAIANGAGASFLERFDAFAAAERARAGGA